MENCYFARVQYDMELLNKKYTIKESGLVCKGNVYFNNGGVISMKEHNVKVLMAYKGIPDFAGPLTVRRYCAERYKNRVGSCPAPTG